MPVMNVYVLRELLSGRRTEICISISITSTTATATSVTATTTTTAAAATTTTTTTTSSLCKTHFEWLGRYCWYALYTERGKGIVYSELCSILA